MLQNVINDLNQLKFEKLNKIVQQLSTENQVNFDEDLWSKVNKLEPNERQGVLGFTFNFLKLSGKKRMTAKKFVEELNGAVNQKKFKTHLMFEKQLLDSINNLQKILKIVVR